MKQQKDVKQTTEGKCPNCNKNVKALEAHIHDRHMKEKKK